MSIFVLMVTKHLGVLLRRSSSNLALNEVSDLPLLISSGCLLLQSTLKPEACCKWVPLGCSCCGAGIEDTCLERMERHPRHPTVHSCGSLQPVPILLLHQALLLVPAKLQVTRLLKLFKWGDLVFSFLEVWLSTECVRMQAWAGISCTSKSDS